MKFKIFNIVAISLIVCFFGFRYAEAATCEVVSLDQDVCTKMKALKGQIDLVDMERDLLQINYPMLEAIGAEMKFTAEEVQKRNPASHLGALDSLVVQTQNLMSLAGARSPESLAVAVRFQNSCLNCHGGSNPSSGYKWTDISENNWDAITPRCNAVANNPYLCKQMHGMKTVFSYYLAGAYSGVQTFKLTEETALEMKRIANDLYVQNFNHGGQRAVFEKIGNDAQAVADLAHNRDAIAYERSRTLIKNCSACHGEGH